LSAIRLRWGVIGTTGFADAIFAPALQNADQEVLGAAGSDPKRSRAFAERHGSSRSYASPDDLLSDPDINAVWVASPNMLHAEHVRMALERGKHVLAEKPLATEAAAARLLADLAEKTGLRLAVAYQGRFHRANQDLVTLVRLGEIGDVAYVRASWQTQYAALPGDWRLHRETSGGWALMDIGTHTLDAALWITDFAEPRRLLAARLSTHHWPVDVDDLAVLLMQLGNTTAVVETATGVQAPANRIEVHGTKGWAVTRNTFVSSLGPAGGRFMTSTGIDRAYGDAPNPYEEQARVFAAWVGGGEYAGTTGAEGAINIELLQTAREWPGTRST
jgi:1,5-anhydro-D-fructose reductase (1,5-anhydro-D-mannitol-forming)